MIKSVSQQNATLLKEKKELEEKAKQGENPQNARKQDQAISLNESRLKDVHVQINKLLANNSALESQNAQLDVKVKELQALNIHLTSIIKDTETKIQQLQSRNESLANAVEGMSTKRMEDALKIMSAEEKSIKANKQLAQLTQKLEAFAMSLFCQ